MADQTKRAVVFDLFSTLVPISADSYRRMLHAMANAIGVEHERFAQAWVSSKRELETGRAGGLESSVSSSPLSWESRQRLRRWPKRSTRG